jgi:predicted small secreted protein
MRRQRTFAVFAAILVLLLSLSLSACSRGGPTGADAKFGVAKFNVHQWR